MPNPDSFTIGIDLGTSSVKVVAVGPDGRVAAHARRDYPTVRSEPGVAEQDPELWLDGLAAALGELAETVPARSWRGAGLTAMLPTLVALDEGYAPVAPALTWQDDRGEAYGTALRARVGEAELYRRTGQIVDGRCLVPMMQALAAREPSRCGRAHWIVGAKDYLFHRLTGELRTDPSTAAGYGCFDIGIGTWIPEIAGLAEPYALPHVSGATTILPATDAAAREFGLPAGLPIVLGAADSVLGALAVGATKPGQVAYLSGSSTVILGVLDGPHFDDRRRFLVTPTAGPDLAAEMDLLATGSAIGWLAALVHGDVRAVFADLPAPTLGSDAPLFLPYLAGGEQGALWDAELTGSIVGLGLSHSERDIVRALASGIVVESSRCLNVLAEVTGLRGDVFAAGSGLPQRIVQDLADASGRRVAVSTMAASHSAYGAALLAAETVGAASTGDAASTGGAAGAAIQGRPGPAFVAEPDAARFAEWAAFTDRYDAVRSALRALKR